MFIETKRDIVWQKLGKRYIYLVIMNSVLNCKQKSFITYFFNKDQTISLINYLSCAVN